MEKDQTRIDLSWTPYGIPLPEIEYCFHPSRKWRFDYCWPSEKIAVEIEGGIWNRGRHLRGAGYLGDMEKYNAGGCLGYRIFRFTPQQLKTGEAQTFMKDVFK